MISFSYIYISILISCYPSIGVQWTKVSSKSKTKVILSLSKVNFAV